MAVTPLRASLADTFAMQLTRNRILPNPEQRCRLGPLWRTATPSLLTHAPTPTQAFARLKRSAAGGSGAHKRLLGVEGGEEELLEAAGLFRARGEKAEVDDLGAHLRLQAQRRKGVYSGGERRARPHGYSRGRPLLEWGQLQGRFTRSSSTAASSSRRAPVKKEAGGGVRDERRLAAGWPTRRRRTSSSTSFWCRTVAEHRRHTEQPDALQTPTQEGLAPSTAAAGAGAATRRLSLKFCVSGALANLAAVISNGVARPPAATHLHHGHRSHARSRGERTPPPAPPALAQRPPHAHVGAHRALFRGRLRPRRRVGGSRLKMQYRPAMGRRRVGVASAVAGC